jgi:hypothetical protein
MRPGARRPPAAPLALAAALATVVAGCFTHEARKENRRAATSPHGEILTVRFRAGPAADDRVETRTGELLEVRDDAIRLAWPGQIVHIPFDRLVTRFQDPPSHRIRARYPRGLTEDQLQRLMDAMGIQRVDTIGVAPTPNRSDDAQSPDRTLHPLDAHAPHPLDAPHGAVLETGPPDPAALDAFLREAKDAAAPYRSLEHAVAAGFRRLGPAFPGMGEHWIHPGRIVTGRVDPARPPVLCYAPIDGEHRLVALAFTVPLEPGEAPPAHPAGTGAWHDHSDHVGEETLLLTHRPSHLGADQPRLAMFHAWLWLDNPDGVLAQNNWRLPFVQAGVDGHGHAPSSDAGRGLSLHTAGPDYYLDLFAAAADLDDAETRAIRQILDRHAASARAWAHAARAGGLHGHVAGPDLGDASGQPSEASRDAPADAPGEASFIADLDRLEALWADLWKDIDQAVRPLTRDALAVLRY